MGLIVLFQITTSVTKGLRNPQYRYYINLGYAVVFVFLVLIILGKSHSFVTESIEACYFD